MPFDISTAKKVGDFDLSTAKHVLNQNISNEEEVPKWVKKSPNLYGLYGAGKGVLDTLQNIPGSAVNYGSDILSTLTSPIQLGRGLQNILSFGRNDPEAMEQLGNKLIGDYGSVSKLNEKIINDPVGFAADVSSVLPVLGAGRSATLTSAGKSIEPLQAVKAGLVKGVGKLIPEAMPENFYQKGLKPLPSLNINDIKEMVKEGLRQEIPLKQSGLEKLQSNIDAMNNIFSSKVAEAKSMGKTINPQDLAGYIDNLDKEVYKFAPTNKFSEQLRDIKGEFMEKWGNKPIPIEDAQKMKQTIYRLYRDNYGELARTEVEAYKGIARGVKDEFIKMFPELEETGQQEHRSLQLESSIERTLKKLGNRDWVGIASPLQGGMAGTLSGSKEVGVITGSMMHILNNPTLSSEIAIQLHKAMQGRVSPGLVKSRLAAYQGSKILQPEKQNQSVEGDRSFIPEAHAEEILTPEQQEAEKALRYVGVQKQSMTQDAAEKIKQKKKELDELMKEIDKK
jgi:hypothetical protein